MNNFANWITLIYVRNALVIEMIMIGILVWEQETATDHLEGVVMNPNTFNFPVRIKKVKGTGLETIVKNPTTKTLNSLIDAAQQLQKEGSKAITTDCGFNAIWQKELADSVRVPVFTSTLLLVPLVYRMLGKGKKVGIITADKSSLTEEHLNAVGINDPIQVCIVGMEEQEEFSSICSGKKTVNTKKLEIEVTSVARSLVQKNHDVGAIVLECTDLSPYTRAVQRETKLPVFDIVGLTNMIHNATHR